MKYLVEPGVSIAVNLTTIGLLIALWLKQRSIAPP